MTKPKKKIAFRTIYGRYSVAMIAVMLISFICLVIVASIFINGYYTDLRKDELARVLESTEKAVSRLYYLHNEDENSADQSFFSKDNIELMRTLSSLTDDYAHYFLLTDREGHILCIDKAAPKLLGDTVAANCLPSAVSANKASRSDLGVFEDKQYFCTLEATFQGEYLVTIYIAVQVSVVKAPINIIIRLLALVAICVMGVALIMTYFVTRHITDPLAKMSLAAKAFAAGDFSVRVDVTGQDELSEFGEVFNEMAQSLENLETMRSDFIANVSHDLRSPMTSITGYINGMLSGVIPKEKHEHYLGIVLLETKRLSRLVSALLDISRIQAGERKFKPMNFNIAEMARQIVISLEGRINEKKLELVFTSSEDRMYAKADMDAIYQVLYNLCDNAAKFARPGGKMSLDLSEENCVVTVSVYNEGEGIPKEDLPFVFDRFYKADKSRGIDKTGTGLGLYIAKKIIEAHGETIAVESEYQKDCRFVFTLPKGEVQSRRPIKPNAQ